MCLLHRPHVQREGDGEDLLSFPCGRIDPSKKNIHTSAPCPRRKSIFHLQFRWTPGETDIDTDSIDVSSDRCVPLPRQTLRTRSIAISTEPTVNPGHLCLHKQVLTHGLIFSYWLAYGNTRAVVSRSAWTTPSPHLLGTGSRLARPARRAGTGNQFCPRGVPAGGGFAAG